MTQKTSGSTPPGNDAENFGKYTSLRAIAKQSLFGKLYFNLKLLLLARDCFVGEKPPRNDAENFGEYTSLQWAENFGEYTSLRAIAKQSLFWEVVL